MNQPTFLRTALGVARKDFLIWLRDPLFTLLTIITPLLLLVVFYLPTGGGVALRVGLVNEDAGPWGAKLVAEIKEIGEATTLYFNVAVEGEEARRAFDERHIPALIVIPKDFSQRIEAGQTATVQRIMSEVDLNAKKNVVDRLNFAVLQFSRRYLLAPEQDMVFRERTLLPHDVPLMVYIAITLFVFAMIFGATLCGGVSVVREWERLTVKPLLISPSGRAALAFGKSLAGLAGGVLSGTAILLLAIFVLDAQIPVSIWPLVLLMMVIVSLAFGGLGCLLGAATNQTIPVFAFTLVVALGTWIACGGMAPLGLMPDWAQAIAALLPPSYAMHALVQLIILEQSVGIVRDFAVLTATALVTVLAAASMWRRVTALPRL